MLIALLISLLFGSGGPEAMFAITDLETRIPATISDLKTQNEVQFIFTRTNNDITTYSKRIAEQGAHLKRQQSERITTSSQLQASFEELFLIRQEFQFLIVDRDTEVREALTDEESTALVTEGIRAAALDPKTAAANAAGWGLQLEQLLDDIRKAITDNIADRDKRTEALDAFEVFDTS